MREQFKRHSIRFVSGSYHFHKSYLWVSHLKDTITFRALSVIITIMRHDVLHILTKIKEKMEGR